MADSRGSSVADGGPDDLPRTLLREREERYRKDRERAGLTSDTRTIPQPPLGRGHSGSPMVPLTEAPSGATGAADMSNMHDFAPVMHAGDGVVRAFKIPFWRLVMFGFKAVFAAVPALILLGALIWGAMGLLKVFFPQLIKMQILIQFPN